MMSKKLGKHAFVRATSLAPVFCAHGDNAETANKSNNPLNLASGVNFQDYYTPKLFDSNVHTNDVLLRGALPMAPNDFIGVPQLLRATLPVISTRPDPHNGYSTGTLINSRMLPDLKLDADGGLTLYVQHKAPAKELQSNWLPAPNGPFYGVLRLYLPRPEVTNGQWKLPLLTPATSQQ
ncbi:hypothetical protein PMI34_02283 [Pseudomonas sp. GM74]|nr:hypothetical protein PMI34_02283 [Pseudomonas sp. GM74]